LNALHGAIRVRCQNCLKFNYSKYLNWFSSLF
jgi:hypothetical protein